MTTCFSNRKKCQLLLYMGPLSQALQPELILAGAPQMDSDPDVCGHPASLLRAPEGGGGEEGT